MKPAITLTRTFGAAPAEVFRAWTDGALLVQWFGPPGFTGTATTDPVVGGAWQSETTNPDVPDMRIRFHGVYSEVDAPRRLAFTLCVPEEAGEERVTVELAPVPEGTAMTFTQGGGNLPRAGYARAASGWELFFGRLDALLAR